MQVATQLSEYAAIINKTSSQPIALAIGNFDGCHLGHQALISKLQELKKNRDFITETMTFKPHPGAFLSGIIQDHIFDGDLKRAAFEEFGVDIAYEQAFDKKFSELSARDFFISIILGGLKVQAVIVGSDFKFGQGRLGDIDLLKNLCHEFGKDFFPIPIEMAAEREIRSTFIRNLIASGQVKKAAELLGRPFLLPGVSVKGKQLGRRIGFPTINLQPRPGIVVPQLGVYAGYVSIDPNGYPHRELKVFAAKSTLMPAAINIGRKPTVDENGEISIEAHVIMAQDQAQNSLAFAQKDLYGARLGFYFVDYIRTEQKCASLDDLKQLIGKDISMSRRILGSHSDADPTK